MSPGFWKIFHEHIISSTSLPNNGCKYNICQVKDDNESSQYIDAKTSEVFVKESRFNYIRPVGGAKRLIIYNCSNVTSLEKYVHRGSKVVVVYDVNTKINNII